MKYTTNDTEHRTETEMETSNKRARTAEIRMSKQQLKRKLAKAKQE